MLEPQPSRRAFLKAGGALVVTFTLGAHAARRQQPPAVAKSVDPDEVGAFLAIDAKGMVTLYSGKVELGTGVLTAVTQIAAEELSVPIRAGHDDPGRHGSHAQPGRRPMPAFRSRTAACRSAARRRPRARLCSTRLRQARYREGRSR